MKRRLSLTLLAFFYLMVSWAQERVVTGKVTRENSTEGLSGVSVTVNGTKTASVTDNSGNFRITVPGNDAILVFTSVGFKRQEIPVGSQNSIDVHLAEEVSAMSDV